MIIKTSWDFELAIFLKALEKREIERYKALGKPYDKSKLTPEGIKEIRQFCIFDRIKKEEEAHDRWCEMMRDQQKTKRFILRLMFIISILIYLTIYYVAAR